MIKTKIITLIGFLSMISFVGTYAANDITRYASYTEDWALEGQFFDLRDSGISTMGGYSANMFLVSTWSSTECGVSSNVAAEYWENSNWYWRLEIVDNNAQDPTTWKFKPWREFESLQNGEEVVFCYSNSSSINNSSPRIRIIKTWKPLIIRTIGSSSEKKILMSQKLWDIFSEMSVSFRCEKDNLFTDINTKENEEKIRMRFYKFDVKTSNNDFGVKIETKPNDTVIDTDDTRIVVNGNVVLMNFYYKYLNTWAVAITTWSWWTGVITDFNQDNSTRSIAYINNKPNELELSLYKWEITSPDDIYKYQLISKANWASLSTSMEITESNTGYYLTLVSHIANSTASPTLKVYYITNRDITMHITWSWWLENISDVKVGEQVAFTGKVFIWSEAVVTPNIEYIVDSEMAELTATWWNVVRVKKAWSFYVYARYKVLKVGAETKNIALITDNDYVYVYSNHVKITANPRDIKVNITWIWWDYGSTDDAFILGSKNVMIFTWSVIINWIEESLYAENFKFIVSDTKIAEINTNGSQWVFRWLSEWEVAVQWVYTFKENWETMQTVSDPIMVNYAKDIRVNITWIWWEMNSPSLFSLSSSNIMTFTWEVIINGKSQGLYAENFNFVVSDPSIAQIDTNGSQWVFKALYEWEVAVQWVYMVTESWSVRKYVSKPVVVTYSKNVEVDISWIWWEKISLTEFNLWTNSIMTFTWSVTVNWMKQALYSENFKFIVSDSGMWSINTNGSQWVFTALNEWNVAVQWVFIRTESWWTKQQFLSDPITVHLVKDVQIRITWIWGVEASAGRFVLYSTDIMTLTGEVIVNWSKKDLSTDNFRFAVSDPSQATVTTNGAKWVYKALHDWEVAVQWIYTRTETWGVVRQYSSDPIYILYTSSINIEISWDWWVMNTPTSFSLPINSVMNFSWSVIINWNKESLTAENFKFIVSNNSIWVINTSGPNWVFTPIKEWDVAVQWVYLKTETWGVKRQYVSRPIIVTSVKEVKVEITWIWWEMRSSSLFVLDSDGVMTFTGKVLVNWRNQALNLQNFAFIVSDTSVATINANYSQGAFKALKEWKVAVQWVFAHSESGQLVQYYSDPIVVIYNKSVKVDIVGFWWQSINSREFRLNPNSIISFTWVVLIDWIRANLYNDNFKFVVSDDKIASVDSNGSQWVLKALRQWEVALQWVFSTWEWTEKRQVYSDPIVIYVWADMYTLAISASNLDISVGETITVSANYFKDVNPLTLDAQNISWANSNDAVIRISQNAGQYNISVTWLSKWTASLGASYQNTDWIKVSSNILVFNVLPKKATIVRSDIKPWIVAPWGQVDFETVVNTYSQESKPMYTEVVFDDDRFASFRYYEVENGMTGADVLEHTFRWKYLIPNDRSLHWWTYSYQTSLVLQDGSRTDLGKREIYVWDEIDLCKNPAICVIRGLRAMKTDTKNDYENKIVSLFTDFPELFNINDIYKRFKDLTVNK